ncbi:MAG: dephospho-CoA kinase [Flavobacteriales bacterium]|nr:dephospho-CoA kinase [Flavobacteriales bacterium]|tara:strand:- start:20914 stop:21507 length:594 start_codon:yes stop_codon:yes gene_type:complete
MSQNKRKIKVGLTGGIGSGKTFVGEVFNRLGLPVFNADFHAKKCMREVKELKDQICKKFGDEIYKDRELQKERLSDIIFSDYEKLQELNSIVHPFVNIAFKEWVKKQEEMCLIKEAAILFESGANKYLDVVVCVSSSMDLRIRRVMKRDNCTKERVIQRISMQMLQEEKEKLSDFIIVNNGGQLILPQLINIIKQIS